MSFRSELSVTVPFACTNAGDLDFALASAKGATDRPARLKKSIDHYKVGCDAGEPNLEDLGGGRKVSCFLYA